MPSSPHTLPPLKEETPVSQLFQFSVCDLGCHLLSYLWVGGSVKKVTRLQSTLLVAKKVVQRFGVQMSSLWKSCPGMRGDTMGGLSSASHALVRNPGLADGVSLSLPGWYRVSGFPVIAPWCWDCTCHRRAQLGCSVSWFVCFKLSAQTVK